jgi:hypothetical protein
MAMKQIVGHVEMACCELCKRRVALNDPACLNWEWFTGYLDRTHHYCPEHKDHRIVKELRATAYRRR